VDKNPQAKIRGGIKMANTKKKFQKVITGKCRLTYVNVFAPRASEGEDPKYSLCLLIPKHDSETLDKITEAVKEAMQEGAPMWGGLIPEDLKLPLRDGEERSEGKPEFEGHYFINASTKYKPEVVDKHLFPITELEELYPGCYGRVSLYFYPYSRGEFKGIGCRLLNVQKLEEGDPLGVRSRADEDFM
jgi:hypothetical protein